MELAAAGKEALKVVSILLAKNKGAAEKQGPAESAAPACLYRR